MKVGVLSTFYNNYNYGGKLQAFALIKAIQQAGWDAEQISYYQPSAKVRNTLLIKGKKFCSTKDYRIAVFQKLIGKWLRLDKELQHRKRAFDRFDSMIPHTTQVFSDDTISSVCAEYDVLICGSDQIWNPALHKKSYFLGFVPAEKYKFSYAASIASDLTTEWKQYFSKELKSFQAVSVREQSSQALLSDLLGRTVSWCADPTLLLDAREWEALSADRVLTEPYVFCYFLGYGRNARKAAKRFARERKCKLVTLPHLLGTAGRFYPEDISFGDEQLYDVSPDQFLALIRYAEYVITDSFHATVMSIVFHKQFVVFDRNGHVGMGTRNDDLLGLFELQNRRCHLKDSYSDICEKLLQSIDYQEQYPAFEMLKKESLCYLKNNLEKAECLLENESKSN